METGKVIMVYVCDDENNNGIEGKFIPRVRNATRK